MRWKPDLAALADLADFARIEVEANDMEPWAEVIGQVHRNGHLTREQAHWVVKGYNAYDDLNSGWMLYVRWPGGPHDWYTAADRRDAADYPCTQERRNLRGGRVLKHLAHYAEHVHDTSQEFWLRNGLRGNPEADFTTLTQRMRLIWGTGRQSAFEWAEFCAKALGYPIKAPDAQLWESEGPRRSLQRLYGEPEPDAEWLGHAATHCREYLADSGIPLSWEDFETIICDFNVMRDGRYYPGRHLAALTQEIDTLPEPGRTWLREAWEQVVPAPWADIAPGIQKPLLPVYRDTGTIRRTP